MWGTGQKQDHVSIIGAQILHKLLCQAQNILMAGDLYCLGEGR